MKKPKNNKNNNYRPKFRAWYRPDFKTKDGPLKFVYSEDYYELRFVLEKDIINKEKYPINYPFYVPFQDNDWVIQQFVGLKDKNGKEIYEGDIVTDGDGQEIFAIVFFDACFVLSAKDCNHTLSKSLVKSWNLKIIGNIFENPELLH